MNNKKLLDNRLKAAQKYFTYCKGNGNRFNLPCPIVFNNRPFTSFANGFSVALTKDRIETETFKDVDLYLDISRLITLSKETETIDLSSAFEKIKEIGYKLKKSAVNGNNMYFFKYNNTFYSAGLVDINFRIINDGKPCEVWSTKDKNPALTIKTNVGYAFILPVLGEWVDFEKASILDLASVKID